MSCLKIFVHNFIGQLLVLRLSGYFKRKGFSNFDKYQLNSSTFLNFQFSIPDFRSHCFNQPRPINCHDNDGVILYVNIDNFVAPFVMIVM